MNAAARLLLPMLCAPLGLSLLHFLWQGSASRMGAAGIIGSRKSATRYASADYCVVLWFRDGREYSSGCHNSDPRRCFLRAKSPSAVARIVK